MPIPILPNDFFTRFDWDSADLDKLGNATALIQTVAESVKEIAKDLTQEVQEREDADTALGSRIDSEVQDRKDADETLAYQIQDESHAREQADAELGTRINTEVQDRRDADSALGTRIDTEVQDRTNADTSLQGAIDAECKAREDADAETSTRIDGVETAYKAADTALGQRIDAIDAAYKAADAELSDKLTQDIATETTRAQGEETILGDRISQLEKTRIWHGRYEFASVPANATQTYSFQLDFSYASADDVSVYVSTDEPGAYPYVVSITPSAFAVGVLNATDSDMTNVTIYAQTVGEVA